MARESVIQETTLDEYKKDVYAGKYQFKVATSTIRTVEKKGGLDEYLKNTSNDKEDKRCSQDL